MSNVFFLTNIPPVQLWLWFHGVIVDIFLDRNYTNIFSLIPAHIDKNDSQRSLY